LGTNYEKMINYYKRQLHRYRTSLANAMERGAPSKDLANLSDKINITVKTIEMVEGNNARRA